MTIQISDPLQLLPYQSGAVTSPGKESAAEASADLKRPQQVAKIGEAVPIVFCRRRNNNGGVFLSPKATEARYANGIAEAVTTESSSNYTRIQEFLDVNLCLVIGEGDMSPLKLNDMFYGECRLGTYAQTYNRRAGTWIPGNFIDAYITSTVSGYTLPSGQAGETIYLKDIGNLYYFVGSSYIILLNHVAHDCPEYCGTSGSYDNMTVVSFEKRFFQLDNWNLQVHAFVREGMKITRLVDSTLGPSDNFVDLAKYLIEKSSAVPSDLIDNTLLASAANFCEANSFFYNGKIEKSVNLSDWMQAHAHFFLLRFSKVNGKFAFRPALPINSDNTIKTTIVPYKYGFTELDLLPDGFEIQFIPLSERSAIIMQMMWREQPSGDIGFARTTNVKFSGTSVDGPFEQHDLSIFCTNENHAVKVGAYMLSRRRNIMHNLRIVVRPGSHSSILSVGDIVRVRLRRETAVDQVEYHDFLYEIDRIEKTSAGPITYDLTHFPIDSQGRSVVALDVNGATGPGIVLDAGRQNFNCDENTASTDLPDVGRGPFDGTGGTPTTPTASDVNQDLTPQGTNPGSGGSSPTGSITNPVDLYDGEPPTIQGYTGTPVAGDTFTFNPCGGSATIKWYETALNTGVKTQVSSGVGQSYVVTTAAQQNAVSVSAESACPGPVESDVVKLFDDEAPQCPAFGFSTDSPAGPGQGYSTRVINVGSGPGTFNFSYSNANLNRFIITGAASHDTGFVTGVVDDFDVTKTSNDPYIAVTVYGPLAWGYLVSCAD